MISRKLIYFGVLIENSNESAINLIKFINFYLHTKKYFKVTSYRLYLKNIKRIIQTNKQKSTKSSADYGHHVKNVML